MAEHRSTSAALLAAGAGLLVTLPVVRRFHILQGTVPDHTPYVFRRPAPELAAVPGTDNDPNEGPVRITVEYNVPLERYTEFTHAIYELRGVRLRDGAMRWGIFREAEHPEHLIESFVMESWLEYLRSRERATAADTVIRDRAYAMHEGPGRPRVSQQIYVREITPGL